MRQRERGKKFTKKANIKTDFGLLNNKNSSRSRIRKPKSKKINRFQKKKIENFALGRSGLHNKRTKKSRMGYTPHSRMQKERFAKNGYVEGIKGFIIKASAISAITILLIIVLGVLGLIGLVSAYSRELPNLDEYFAQQKKEGKESIIYDRTGKTELRRIRGEKIKIRVKIADVPDKLKWSFLVTEDDNFYTHKGLDYIRLSQAILCHARGGAGCGGASTITQQVIKKTTNDDDATLDRKIREAISAMEIENKWEKDTILEFYLNLVPMGGVVEGVKAGSIYLFNEDNLNELSLAQMVVIASIPNEPNALSPIGTQYSKEKLIFRTSYILDRMVKLNDRTGVTQEEAEKAKEEIENMTFSTDNYFINFQDFEAYHFTNYVLSDLEKILADQLPPELVESEEGVEKYLGDKGYKIITTLDLRYQKIVEETIKTQIDTEYFQTQVGAQNAAAVIMDPKTGQILTMVGSKDFRLPSSEDQKFDPEVNVTIKERSMGSTMKPILYLSAFEKGHTAKSVLPDMPLDLRSPGASEEYFPQNYDRGSYRNALIPIDQALQFSLNVPAVSAFHLVGGESYADTFVRLNGWEPIKDRMYPSSPLGAANVPLLEQTHAYNTIAGGGIRYPKISILRIEDSNGNIVKNFEGTQGERTVQQKHTIMITELNKRYYTFTTDDLLQKLQNEVVDIAGKTGTSDNSEGRPGDTTFIAYTPSMTFGMWAGNNCGADQCPLTGVSATGEQLYFGMYKIALQKLFDQGLLGNERFPTTAEGLTVASVCPQTGRLASEQCPGVSTLADANQLPPSEDMYKRAEVTRCGDSYKLARDIDRELGLTEQLVFFDYKFPYQYVADQVNKVVGKGKVPTEICDIPRQITPPSIRILTPPNNTSYGANENISIEVDVIKTLAVSRVELLVNGIVLQTKLSSPYSFNLNSSSLREGQNTIEVRAYDIKGNLGNYSLSLNKASTNVSPPITPSPSPSVTITSPPSGQNVTKGSNLVIIGSISLGNYKISDMMVNDALISNSNGQIVKTASIGYSEKSFQFTVPTNDLQLGTHTIQVNIVIGTQTYSSSITVVIV